MQEIQLVTVGNPNCGKTTLFNALTGSRQQVGNWSGVTVDKKSGRFSANDIDFNLIDLPGIYSLDDQNETGSIDEQIAFNYVMDHRPELVINILDAACLERGLYLSLQLRELGLPQLVIINKIESQSAKHVTIDTELLAKQIGCPVLALSALDKKAVSQLKSTMASYVLAAKEQIAYQLPLPNEINQACSALCENHKIDFGLEPKALALRLLEGDSQLLNRVPESLANKATKLSKDLSLELELDLEIADCRYTQVYTMLQACKSEHRAASVLTKRIDRLLLHPICGIPIFLFVIYLLFMFTINVGSAFIDFFDILVGAFLVDGSRLWFESLGLPQPLITLLSDGVGAGIQTVATFIPVIAALFLGLSLLERSGYMARAAFVVDSLMQKIGLPGKSFVPLIIGFGCSVPAIMATRTLEQERERIVTSMMSPFISCGAKLPVYVLFATAFFPDSGQNLVFALYLIGIFVAIATGLVLKKTLLPGNSDHYVMELPTYELPKLSSILLTTWHRLKGFILGAGKTIVLVVALLNVANSISLSGEFHSPGEGDSILSETAKMLTPLLSPIGIKEDNWPATVGIITGIFAKEAVVGTLNSLYVGESADEQAFSLMERIDEAIASISTNLLGISAQDPLGINVGELKDQQSAAADQDVAVATFDEIRQQFDGQLGAFAYLLFILLYMPCAAAMGALVKEVGRNWAVFAASWSTGLALAVSTLFYQISHFNLHPLSSSLWIITWLFIACLAAWSLSKKGKSLAMSQAL